MDKTSSSFIKHPVPPPIPIVDSFSSQQQRLICQHQSQQPNTQAGDATSAADLNSENEQFLKECLTNVFDGQGVGWLKYNRVRRLMEDENYRNFVLSRLNTSLDKKLANDEEHIECVRISKPVFKVSNKKQII